MSWDEAARRRWPMCSELPTVIASSERSKWRGSEFQLIEVPRHGTFEQMPSQQLRIGLNCGPIKIRHGGARSPFLDAPLSPQVGLPGDGSRGAWLGAQRGMHLFVDKDAFERVTHQPLQANRLMRSNDPRPVISHLMKALLEDTISGHPAGSILGEEIIAAILSYLCRESVFAEQRTLHLSSKKIQTICDVIEAELHAQITLEKLAGTVGLSVRHLCRAFRQTVGLSPHQYILSRRIDRAIKLLGDAELTLEEISEAVGFANHAHMTATFRRLLGTTPVQIRQSRR
jgi:AraC-like DNA-binding protein